MKRKWFAIAAFVLLLFLYLIVLRQLWHFHPNYADFLVKCLAPFGTIGAVLVALFRDYLHDLIFPVELIIEEPKEYNDVIDETDFTGERWKVVPKELREKRHDVYVHHLSVRNLNPHRPIEDCRVWLKKVLVQGPGGTWSDYGRFAVPRMMEWAPAEFSRDKRTFLTDQLFDIGLSLSNNDGFLVTVERGQGGRFEPLFSVGAKLRLVFFATANNYRRQKEFCFEIEVRQPVTDKKVTPALVAAVRD